MLKRKTVKSSPKNVHLEQNILEILREILVDFKKKIFSLLCAETFKVYILVGPIGSYALLFSSLYITNNQYYFLEVGKIVGTC